MNYTEWLTNETQNVVNRLGGELYISMKGVPMCILPFRGRKCNITYFGRAKVWRWFYPTFEFNYKQQRMDFDSVFEFEEFYNANKDQHMERLTVIS